LNEILRAIAERRSIREFEERELPREAKDAVIEAALRAPTAGNMMLYSIIEVSDQGLKDRLALSCDRQPMIGKAPWVLLFLADYQRWMDYFELCDLSGFCAARGEEMARPRAGDLLLAVDDALIAAQTAVIAAESLGLGSCYVGDVMERIEEHRDLFDLPRYVFPAALLCIGYPAERQLSLPRRGRFDRRHIVFENRYQKRNGADFDEMFAAADTLRLRPGAANYGQNFYQKKFAAPFSRELRRSVSRVLEDWS
jgi:nitroreductase